MWLRDATIIVFHKFFSWRKSADIIAWILPKLDRIVVQDSTTTDYNELYTSAAIEHSISQEAPPVMYTVHTFDTRTNNIACYTLHARVDLISPPDHNVSPPLTPLHHPTLRQTYIVVATWEINPYPRPMYGYLITLHNLSENCYKSQTSH